jgi:hypothetical protein
VPSKHEVVGSNPTGRAIFFISKVQMELELNDLIETDLEDTNAYNAIRTMKENEKIIRDEFIESLEKQYKELDSELLGFNLFADYGITDYEISTKFLNFVNDNYIGITNIEQIIYDTERTILISRYVYEFLFVDIFNRYLPFFMREKNIEFPEMIVHMGYQVFRDSFRLSMSNYLDVLNTSKKDEDTSNIDLIRNREIIKLTTVLELLDDDLEDFCENFLYKVIFNYEFGDF